MSNDIKDLSLARDMFSSHTLVFFFDEQIGSIDDKTNLTFAYPLGSTQGAPFHSHEGALRFLMDVRNKSVTGKCVSVQALVYQESRSTPQDEGEANAKLVAAAPDMLQALEEAREVLLHYMDAPEWSAEHDEVYERVKSAISKTI